MKESKSLENIKPIRKNGSRVKRVFDKVVTAKLNGKKLSVRKAMEGEGYSQSSINCDKVLGTATWKQLIKRFNDDDLMQVFDDFISPTNEDKRVRLAAAIEMCKLKDLYPKKRLSIETLNSKNDEFLE